MFRRLDVQGRDSVASHFNDDGDANHGCEGGLSQRGSGTNSERSDASECTAVNCDAGRFDADGNANHGYEAGCSSSADGMGTPCSTPPRPCIATPTASALTAMPTTAERQAVLALQAEPAHHAWTNRCART